MKEIHDLVLAAFGGSEGVRDEGLLHSAVAAAQMLELINVAATMGMATSRQTLLDGATVRNIFTGHSGYMGLMAVRLVECGFTGEIDSVSAIYRKVLSDTFDSAKVAAGLGTEWLIEALRRLDAARRYRRVSGVRRYVQLVVAGANQCLR